MICLASVDEGLVPVYGGCWEEHALTNRGVLIEPVEATSKNGVSYGERWSHSAWCLIVMRASKGIRVKLKDAQLD